MTSSMVSSRERMLTALNCEEPDRTPCSFMMYKGLHASSPDYATFIERQVEMGLDAYVMIPSRPPVVVNDHYNLHGMPVSYDPRVKSKEWMERRDGEQWPIMVKEYHTPAGVLRAEVRQTEDWRWGDHVPFLDDYITPRSLEFIVTGPDDLDALRYLLVPPTDAEIEKTRRESAPILDLAKQHGLLVAAGWGIGADLLGWILGLDNMVFAAYDRSAFLQETLDIVAEWNQQRMHVLLDIGIDLYIKRAWYETCHFWTPRSFQEFLLPITKAEADLAHQAGAKFGYIATVSTMPLLTLYPEAGIDVLIGVDPHEWDLAQAKRTLDGKVCLWGGVNGHLTVEMGAPDEVRHEVQAAMEVLSPGGGFILSPVDNVRENTQQARQNVKALVDEWQKLVRRV